MEARGGKRQGKWWIKGLEREKTIKMKRNWAPVGEGEREFGVFF